MHSDTVRMRATYRYYRSISALPKNAAILAALRNLRLSDDVPVTPTRTPIRHPSRRPQPRLLRGGSARSTLLALAAAARRCLVTLATYAIRIP